MRYYRPTKRPDIPTDLVERYKVALDAGDGPGMDAVMEEAKAFDNTKDVDTEALVQGKELVVEFNRVRPDPPWEVGETIGIKNQAWDVVCEAMVIEARPLAYVLRGLPPDVVGD